MVKSLSIKDALNTAVNALNSGDPLTASKLALQILQDQPNSHDAMTVLGAARMAILSNPHNVFFLKLRSLGFSPKSVVDIGAYEGQWTTALKIVFPEAHALMVEAQSGKASQLEKVCSDFSNVTYKVCLLGKENADDTDFHVMNTPYGSTGSSIYSEQTNFERDVISLPMRTLDNLLADTKVQPDLLKIDVQGAELDVLSGATHTLPSVQFIHMELSVLQYNLGAPLVAEVLPRLNRLGFVLFDILEEHRITNDVLSQLDALFVRKGLEYRPSGVLF